ncbi:hypothetical protein J2X45_001701 [Caulobacter sp. BE264]|uniref:hypothetical protein n=1 Tax=Caulobacter sp. BE264 TaxID=2817724 RepID=UPI002861211A|nr:hypothetical protein [Caulobacter sp. BE264]MDR7230610.1 hypothetical protein [Caulobacter sp. BE264]
MPREAIPPFTLIRGLGVGVEEHPSLEAVALRIQALRGKQALSVAPCVGAYDTSETFQGFNIKVGDRAGGPTDWIATVVLPHADGPQLQAAIRAAGKPLRRAA